MRVFAAAEAFFEKYGVPPLDEKAAARIEAEWRGTGGVMRKTKASNAMKLLEKIAGGPLTLGRAVESVRKSEELTQDACAKKLGISRSHLCDVEKGRKTVSPERAAKWARILGYPEVVLVRLAIQGELDAAGLKYKVEINAA